MKEDKSIDFVARHYREGSFAVEKALRSIRPVTVSWWTRGRIAAAVVVLLAVSATAAVMIGTSLSDKEPLPEVEYQTVSATAVVRIIDFEEAPLTEVIKKINEVYGVEITDIPENAADFTLSLHYEGSATDLVETINNILGTEMTVKQ